MATDDPAAASPDSTLPRDSDSETSPLLCAIRPDRWQRLAALAVVAGSLVFFVLAAPSAKQPLAVVWAFLPIYQSAYVVITLVTAVLLIGQFQIQPSRALLILAGGYLFDAQMAVAHLLSFPGLFTPAGLLTGGSQTTAWLYFLWHGGFALFVAAFGLLKDSRLDPLPTSSGATVFATVAAVTLFVMALVLLTTGGHDLMPPLMNGNMDGPRKFAVAVGTTMIGVAALVVLVWSRRLHSLLDLWLTVVIFVWILDSSLASILNSRRFDLGWYAGRSYGLIAGSVVLIVLLSTNNALFRLLLRLRSAEQRRSVEQLQASDARFTATFEQAAMGIAMVAPDGHWLRANRKLCDIVGYSEEELRSLTFQDITHPDDLAGDLAYSRQILAGERRTFTTEKRYLRKDGRIVWINLTVALVRKPDGSPDYFISVIEDITERKRTEAALCESEERLHLFVEHAPVALAMFDHDMRYLAVSRRWLTDYALGGRDIIGRSHYEILPEIPERWKSLHRRCLDGEIVRMDEDPFQRANGTTQWLRWEIHPWHLADGTIGGIVIFSDDITERKRAALAVVEREAQYRAVVETSADGFWMVDDDGRILATNAAYARRSGYDREELVGLGVDALEAQESSEEVRRHVAKVRSAGSDLFETWHRTKSGELWPVEVNAAYWPEAGGRFFVFLRDLTERKKTEAALLNLRTEMERLTKFQIASQTVAAIAHELNQPLNAVAAYAEAAQRLLRTGNSQPDKLQHAIESSAIQAQRAGRVVRELIAFVNQGEVETEPLDINRTVSEVVSRVKAAAYHGVAFRLDLAGDLGSVNANRLQVEKVLINLVENGIEAMHEAGIEERSIAIDVKTAADASMAQVTVTDSGPGIGDEIMRRVFEPFFTTKRGGLGMGLAISRAIIEAHGGQLWIESTPGAGASFHFTLPFAP